MNVLAKSLTGEFKHISTHFINVSPFLKLPLAQTFLRPPLFTRESCQLLSQDEPRLELQDAMSLLPARWHIVLQYFQGDRKAKTVFGQAFLFSFFR